ncbi:MAG: hypothetical protein U1C96_02830 [Gallionella sp.]|nr:hypothetical protein [Gallionella sp.]
MTEYKSTPWIIDRSPVSSSLRYTPCPKCGEPRPILPDGSFSPLNRWIRKLVIPLLLLAATGIGWAIYLNYAH